MRAPLVVSTLLACLGLASLAAADVLPPDDGCRGKSAGDPCPAGACTATTCPHLNYDCPPGTHGPCGSTEVPCLKCQAGGAPQAAKVAATSPSAAPAASASAPAPAASASAPAPLGVVAAPSASAPAAPAPSVAVRAESSSAAARGKCATSGAGTGAHDASLGAGGLLLLGLAVARRRQARLAAATP